MVPVCDVIALAQAVAGAAAPPASPDRLVALLPQTLPGCRAAAAARWKDGRAVEVAASSRGVAELLASQLERGTGPAVTAVQAGHVWCPDTRDERRWPGFREDALRLGTRSLVTLARRGAEGDAADSVTVTAYGVRPRQPALEMAVLAWLFAGDSADAGISLAALSAGTASQEAAALLMQALGTGDEEQARALLDAIARSRRCASEDAARWLVAEHARGVARIWKPAASGPAAGGRDRPATPRQPVTRSDGATAEDRTMAAAAGNRRAASRFQASPRPLSHGQRRPPLTPRPQPPAANDAMRSSPPIPAVRHAAQLRQQFASIAGALAQTGARLADTLDQGAENLPKRARQLTANAHTARKYSHRLRHLARNFGELPQLDRAGN